MRFSLLVPGAIPKTSPSVTRTAGAKATTVLISGLLNQESAVSIWSFSAKAPTGHTSVHWPH